MQHVRPNLVRLEPTLKVSLLVGLSPAWLAAEETLGKLVLGAGLGKSDTVTDMLPCPRYLWS